MQLYVTKDLTLCDIPGLVIVDPRTDALLSPQDIQEQRPVRVGIRLDHLLSRHALIVAMLLRVDEAHRTAVAQTLQRFYGVSDGCDSAGNPLMWDILRCRLRLCDFARHVPPLPTV